MQVVLDVTHEAAGLQDAPGGGAALRSDPTELLPRLQEVLRQTALTLNELLRHFWACFPTSSKPRMDKLERVYKGLEEQHRK